jgi:hypothetical protein
MDKFYKHWNSKEQKRLRYRNYMKYRASVSDCSSYGYKFGPEASYLSSTDNQNTAKSSNQRNADEESRNLSSSNSSLPEKENKDTRSIENKDQTEHTDHEYNRVIGKGGTRYQVPTMERETVTLASLKSKVEVLKKEVGILETKNAELETKNAELNTRLQEYKQCINDWLREK